MHILLTGATGFLGKRVLSRLTSAGFEVIAPVRRVSLGPAREFQNPPGLICWPIPEEGTKSVWRDFPGIKGIVHTATNYGRPGSNLAQVLDANLHLPIELIEGGLSSGVQYVVNIDTFLSKEPRYNGALQNYVNSKKAFVIWLEAFSGHLNAFNLQIEHMYGPDDHSEKFIPWLVNEIAVRREREVSLTDGLQTRDFIHVEDVADAILTLVKREHPRVFSSIDKGKFVNYSIGTGVSTSVREVSTLVKEISGSDTLLRFGSVSLSSEEPRISVSDKRFQADFGWEPHIPLEYGITELTSSTETQC